MSAVVILGMHRSGTSCVAGMLIAGGVASAGVTVRNWDNPRGHHESLDVVRLNEAVLAESGGHYLRPPAEVRWTAAQAAARDRLLLDRPDGRAALLKDPRTLLTLPFWRASSVGFAALAVVRHPLAVARSLESWRELPLADGLALWTAHNRPLELDRARHGGPLVDFDRPREAVIADVAAVARALAPTIDEPALAPTVDEPALAAAFDDALVHHDAGDPPDLPGLADALALHRRLVGDAAAPARPRFPRAALAELRRRLATGERDGALALARAALAEVGDRAAVVIPVVAALLRHRAHAAAAALVDDLPSDATGLPELLRGKVALAAGDPESAARHLERACAVARPYHQARQLLPHALRAIDRRADATGALRRLAREALYPHGPLSTLAEWHWRDGEPAAALAAMGEAIAAAPPHRRGRLRCRRADWLLAAGRTDEARRELARAVAEDPAYPRSRARLAALG